MSWTDIFRSRYVRSLESELAQIRQRHEKEIRELKNANAEELSRCINEANRGWAEADRLRQYLIPGLPTSTRQAEPDNTPPVKDEVETGTPWQRVLKREMKAQEEMARLKEEAAKRNQFPTPKVATPAETGKEN